MKVPEKIKGLEIFDVGILAHGFAPWMRDYFVVYEVGGETEYAGRYRCDFTHCVRAVVETRVIDAVWSKSWTDEFINHANWIAAGEPEGFVWGVNWSLAYPGLNYVHNSREAKQWSRRLQREMHEVTLETEAFNLRLIFHDVTTVKLGRDIDVMKHAFWYLDSGA